MLKRDWFCFNSKTAKQIHPLIQKLRSPKMMEADRRGNKTMVKIRMFYSYTMEVDIKQMTMEFRATQPIWQTRQTLNLWLS